MALLFRSTLIQSLAKSARPMWTAMNATQRRTLSSHKKETDEEFDERWKAYFDRPNIDGEIDVEADLSGDGSSSFRLGYSSRY